MKLRRQNEAWPERGSTAGERRRDGIKTVLHATDLRMRVSSGMCVKLKGFTLESVGIAHEATDDLSGHRLGQGLGYGLGSLACVQGTHQLGDGERSLAVFQGTKKGSRGGHLPIQAPSPLHSKKNQRSFRLSPINFKKKYLCGFC